MDHTPDTYSIEPYGMVDDTAMYDVKKNGTDLGRMDYVDAWRFLQPLIQPNDIYQEIHMTLGPDGNFECSGEEFHKLCEKYGY